jgi:hypothetical protein
MTNESNNCAFCGTPLSPNARFCEACGQPVASATPSPFEAEPASAETWSQPDTEEFPIPPMPETDRWGSPQTIAPSPSVATPQSPRSQTPPAPATGKKFPWVGVLIAGAVLILLSCLCVVVLGAVLFSQNGSTF